MLVRYSPLHADLRGLPTTLVATAEHDPLRDEGAALVGHLRCPDVDAHHLPHPGLVHGFITLDTVSPAAKNAGDVLMSQLGRLLARRGWDCSFVLIESGAPGRADRPTQPEIR